MHHADLGTGDHPDPAGPHHPRYDFDEAILPLAASSWVRLAEACLV